MVSIIQDRSGKLPPFFFSCNTCGYEVWMSRKEGRDELWNKTFIEKRGEHYVLKCPKCGRRNFSEVR